MSRRECLTKIGVHVNTRSVTVKVGTDKNEKKNIESTMPVTKSTFDNAQGITRYTITNSSNSLSVSIIDYGATLVNVLVKDRNGQTRDVVLGFDDLDGYQNKRLRNPYFGATIGRVANR